ncbi:hypothetical protein GOBAR_DD25275 [Gossypium barbadense]|nr:hypothetical protein GOBAR_DD25275 [Gossypium barbadense]
MRDEGDSHCSRYGEGVESILHILRDCLFARGLWNSIVPNRTKDRFFSLPLQEWVLWNLLTAGRFDIGNDTWISSFPLLFGSSGSIATHMFSKGHIAILRIYWLQVYPGRERISSSGKHQRETRWTAKELKRRLSAELYEETR